MLCIASQLDIVPTEPRAPMASGVGNILIAIVNTLVFCLGWIILG